MPTWVQHPETGKLIPKDEYVRETDSASAIHVVRDFVSPIDGSVIGDKKQLAEHNRRHGVTDIRDYGENYFEKKSVERTHTLHGSDHAARKERLNTIMKAMAKHEGGN